MLLLQGVTNSIVRDSIEWLLHGVPNSTARSHELHKSHRIRHEIFSCVVTIYHRCLCEVQGMRHELHMSMSQKIHKQMSHDVHMETHEQTCGHHSPSMPVSVAENDSRTSHLLVSHKLHKQMSHDLHMETHSKIICESFTIDACVSCRT